MSLTVRCERCGSSYETQAPLAAIREVNRCRECGGGPLVIEREEDEPPTVDAVGHERRER